MESNCTEANRTTSEYATTNDTELTTAFSVNDSSEPFSIYFKSAVIAVGIIGSLANGVGLFSLVFSEQTKRKMMNVLIINQLTIDMFSCVMIVLSYSVSLIGIYPAGTWGFLYCLTMDSQQLMWIGLNSSDINLVIITIERYLKIVHSIWHKTHFKVWMAYASCTFSWISGFATFIFGLVGMYLSDGQCLTAASLLTQNAGSWLAYFYYYQIPVIIYVFCYSRIFHVIRRRNRVGTKVQNQHQSASATNSTANQKSSGSQVNAVKTMTFIVVFFAISWLPIYVYYVIFVATNFSMFLYDVWFNLFLFMGFFNICANPFIYMVGYTDIRLYLASNFSQQMHKLRSLIVSNHTETSNLAQPM